MHTDMTRLTRLANRLPTLLLAGLTTLAWAPTTGAEVLIPYEKFKLDNG